MTTYAATVEDEEYGLHTSATRRGAIDGALEPLLEAVSTGHKEPGEWTVVVHTDPKWCEKAPQDCDEHDHHQYSRWLDGSASWEDVDIEVYFAHPEIEDIGPEWQYVGIIDRLREAFPALIWKRQSDTPGAALSGGTPNCAKHWAIVVEPDLSRWLLHGEFVNFGDDPIGELRAAIAAEGREIAWRADRLTKTAQLLGQPQPPRETTTLTCEPAHLLAPCQHCDSYVSGSLCSALVAKERDRLTRAMSAALAIALDPPPGAPPVESFNAIAELLETALAE